MKNQYSKMETVNQPQPPPLDDEEWLPTSRPKLTPYPANEVIILPIKDSWSRGEIKGMLIIRLLPKG